MNPAGSPGIRPDDVHSGDKYELPVRLRHALVCVGMTFEMGLSRSLSDKGLRSLQRPQV